MKPSLETLKLEVAKILPDEIVVTEELVGNGVKALFRPTAVRFAWKDGKSSTNKTVFVTDREWLHVAHLAEQTLTDEENEVYLFNLHDICGADNFPSRVAVFASAEHRLEALVRTRKPELFTVKV